MVVVEFSMPLGETDSPEFWLPDSLKDLKIKIEHIALWEKWDNPNSHLGTFVAFISEEDATMLLLTYPEMKEVTRIWGV